MITSESGLLGVTGFKEFDAIVVEGYDGVGKGRVLGILSNYLGVTPYRPDYNLWQNHDLRKKDRWKISGFFWDIFSHFGVHLDKPMLFDRGCISGAVYGGDSSIVDDYPKLLRDMKVLHVLVECSKEDFIKFQRSRNPDIQDHDIELLWIDYEYFTSLYKDYFTMARVDWVSYYNRFNEEESERLKVTCAGCGHYSYGVCTNPKINRRVHPGDLRCEHSADTEVQDLEVGKIGTEMQCV